MQLCLLVTEEMRPIPDGVRVIQDYGPETLVPGNWVNETNPVTKGYSMHLEAERGVFVEWLRPFDGIWKSDCPASGQWEVVHIK
jgi:hypothetical protein